MSLYGDSPVYLKGAVANAKLARKIYSKWTMRIYCETFNYDMNIFRKLDCEIVAKPKSKLHSGMFWRFLAAWDVEAERVIFRDADSRLNLKEAAAVRAWEESGLDSPIFAPVIHPYIHISNASLVRLAKVCKKYSGIRYVIYEE